MKKKGLITIALLACMIAIVLPSSPVCAQSTAAPAAKESYAEVINKRADKVVAGLKSTDAVFNKKVQAVVADQYISLGKIHDERNEKIKAIKASKAELTADDKNAIQQLEAKADQQLDKLHTSYLKKLSKLCTPEQVNAIKDGMTYGVLPLTYGAYQDMIPALTEEQKKQILTWLTEAREKAMDAESSNKKHAWFGKYKGRINNYLSAAGYDMKKEEAAWMVRIKERKANQNK
jgi:Spy/CpxP family protein refolding chaperone